MRWRVSLECSGASTMLVVYVVARARLARGDSPATSSAVCSAVAPPISAMPSSPERRRGVGRQLLERAEPVFQADALELREPEPEEGVVEPCKERGRFLAVAKGLDGDFQGFWDWLGALELGT